MPKPNVKRFDPELVKRVEKEGHHLVVLEIDGWFAKKGKMTFHGSAGPETTKWLYEVVFRRLSDDKEMVK